MKRLNLDITEEIETNLSSLRADTGASSLAEVIRRALTLYRYVVDLQKSGGPIVLKTESGEVNFLVL